MTAESSIGGLPSPIMSRAPSNTVTVPAWLSSREEQAAAANRDAATNRPAALLIALITPFILPLWTTC